MKKNNKDNKKSLLDSRNVRILLSVLIAVVIWMIVTLAINPGSSTYFSGVPVDFGYDSDAYAKLGLDMVKSPEAKVKVTLKGDGGDLAAVENAGDMIVYPDFSSVKGAGEYELPLKVRLKSSQLNNLIEATADGKVTVVFDTVEEKTFDVEVEVQNGSISVAEGYVLHGTTAKPGKVTVSGPQGELDKIARIVAPLGYSDGLQDLTESKLATVELEARSADNEPVALQYVSMDNTLADVNISVYQTLTLPLKVNFINVPSGFDVNTLDYTLSQQHMTVTGRPSVLNALTELAVSDFDLANSFALDKAYQLNVELPDGVESVDNITTVTLTFNTEGLATKTVNVSNLRLINQPANMQIKLNTNRLNNVVLVGPKEELEKLSASAVSAVIDAGSVQITEGTENMAAEVRVPSSSSIFAVGSYSAECSIQVSGAGG